jgi:hypothetical protein
MATLSALTKPRMFTGGSNTFQELQGGTNYFGGPPNAGGDVNYFGGPPNAGGNVNYFGGPPNAGGGSGAPNMQGVSDALAQMLGGGSGAIGGMSGQIGTMGVKPDGKGPALVGQFPTGAAQNLGYTATAQPAAGGFDFMSAFDSMYKQNPMNAYLATTHQTTPFGSGFVQNQGAIRDRYFGGNQQAMNQWINDSSYGASGVDRENVANMLMGMFGSQPSPGFAAPAQIGGTQPMETGGLDPMPGLAGSESSTNVQNLTGYGNPAQGLGNLAGQFNLDINKFLDPSMGFRIDQGQKALESSAAARGGLLSGATLRGVQDYAQNIASQEYGNAVNRAMSDRSFNYGMGRDDRDFAYRSGVDNRNFAYGLDRDNRDFSYRAQSDDWMRNFDRDRYNNDLQYRAAVDNRNFNFDRDKYNQQFGYNAQRDDRNFNYGTLSDLARLGLSGTQGSTSALTTLANILNQNIMAGGNAGAAGAIGGSNAINSMISQLLQQLQNNQILGQLGGP